MSEALLQELLDREAIKETKARYCAGSVGRRHRPGAVFTTSMVNLQKLGSRRK